MQLHKTLNHSHATVDVKPGFPNLALSFHIKEAELEPDDQ